MHALSSSSSPSPHPHEQLAPCFSRFKESCSHPQTFNGVCLSCARTVGEGYGLSFNYMLRGLEFGKDEVARLKRMNSEIAFGQRKLQLVLDLDHTLLHAADVDMLAPDDRDYLMKRESSASDGGGLFMMDGGLLLVKLRPYIRSFLREACKMYDIYICTMGTRHYAEMIAKLLDPKCEYYISSRLITYEDFKETGKKNLDLVLGQERGVVIVDDTAEVWKDHKENLILVGKYNYFKEGIRKSKNNDQKSYSERKSDESELNGALVNVLRVLKRVHELFFENPENLVWGDVRSFLGKIRRQILAGCTLFFNIGDVGPQEFPLLRQRAEELGAACTDVHDSSVTHVVSTRQATEGRRLAEQHNNFLVHPRWIYAAYYLWSRQAENDYFPL